MKPNPSALETEESTPCTKCSNPVHWLAVFPGGICLACHEKRFNAEVARNGGDLPKPDFANLSHHQQ